MSHPETKKDEMFAGNLNTKKFNLNDFSKDGIKFRFGSESYFIDGKKMTDTNAYKPLFIHKDSVNAYEKHQEDKLRKYRR